MSSNISETQSLCQDEFPPRANLRQELARRPIPALEPGLIDPTSVTDDECANQARAMLNRLNNAIAAHDVQALADCFFPTQAYWRDQLALTYHLRTFSAREVVAAALLETTALRGLDAGFEMDGEPEFVPAKPTLQFITSDIMFQTASPKATCRGKILLLPVKRDGQVQWKIWILSTLLRDLDVQKEDPGRLRLPGRSLDGVHNIDTDVFIIGGGNAAVSLSARLKALGVESIMAERNANPGDNWARRYDYMRFHIPTSSCDLAFMAYDEELRSPHLLSRDELASQIRRYVETFNLNMITSAGIQSTRYDPTNQRWQVEFQTPAGPRTAVSKHLVVATGFGSQKPYLPPIADSEIYRGVNVHSAQFQNGQILKEQGVKSVVVVGSANTAFDVIEDCHAAGIETTMVARSPTYVIPLDYLCDKRSLGAYDLGVNATDWRFHTMPTFVDGQMAAGLMAHFASEEPKRYEALAEAGFPVLDSAHPDAVLLHHLLERGGGHYVDVGGTKLLADGKVGIKAGVEPVAYTATGLRFSDGSTIDTDAVVWCTGFADKDIRRTAREILGESAHGEDKGMLTAETIAARLDATWCVDPEGEVRGLWKRHLRLDDNFWIMGGFTSQHRWHSRTLALQIKAALEGILPPAYRDTPTADIQ